MSTLAITIDGFGPVPVRPQPAAGKLAALVALSVLPLDLILV